MPINYPLNNPRTGDGGLGGDSFLAPKVFLLTAPDFSIATKAACATETSYTAGIINETVFNLGRIFDMEDASIEPKYAESQQGYKQKTMPKVIAYKVMYNFNEDQIKQINKIEGNVYRAIIADQSNKIKLIEDGTSYKGAKTLPIYIDRSQATPEKPGLLTVYIQFEDATELDTKAIVVPVTWTVSDLPALTQITLVAGAVAANAFQIDCNYVSNSITDNTGVARTGSITGLVTANVKVTSALGVARVVTGAVASTTVSGRYAVAATASVATDTVQIIPSVDMPFISNIVTLTA